MLKVLDLFSGIGGFSLGLERTGGFETVAFCEIEPFPRSVLKKHWPDVPCFDDIRKLKGSDIGPVDVICGGYPCQPFSTAGQRRGKEDDRHLWPEFSRLVAELRPAWVIGENVAGHVSMGLDDVLSDLEGQGYACRTFIIPACAVDAPHRRARVWTVAHSQRVRHGERGDERDIHETDGRQVGECSPIASSASEPAAHMAAQNDPDANGKRSHRAGVDLQRSSESDDGQERVAGSVREVLAGSGGAGKRGAKDVAHRESGGRGPGRQGGSDCSGEGETQQALQDVANPSSERRAERGKPGTRRAKRVAGTGSASKDVADTSQAERERDRGSRRGEHGPADLGIDVADADDTGGGTSKFEVDENRQATIKGRKIQPLAESDRHPDPPGTTGLPKPGMGGMADGFSRWLDEPDIGRVAVGVPNRTNRLKALGNAVVPQIPEILGYAILDAIGDQNG